MSNPVIVAELHRIAAQHSGKLRPVDVVAAAKSKTSPLHSKFEWDDSAAAQRYRLWQARQLIAVTVEYIGSGDEAVLSRVFVSLTSDRKKGGYRTTVAVLSDTERRKQLLSDATEEMERFEQKYAELKELASVFDAMRKVRSTGSRRRQPELTAAS